MKNKLVINCSCNGDEYMKLLQFEDEIGEVYIHITGCGIYSLKGKLKTAWKILKYGEFENYGMLVSKNDAKKIIKYLDRFIRNDMALKDVDKKLDDILTNIDQ